MNVTQLWQGLESLCVLLPLELFIVSSGKKPILTLNKPPIIPLYIYNIIEPWNIIDMWLSGSQFYFKTVHLG